MKKVCMVAYTYYLSDPRVRREAEALASRGDEVDFICLRKEGEIGREKINGVNLYRLPIKRYRGDTSVSYILGYLSFFFQALFKLSFLFLKKGYNVIHINTMPDFMVFTAIIPKLFGKRIILDVHDIMPDLYMSKFGISEKHILIRLIKFFEVISAKFSDQVIVTQQLHKDILVRYGVPSNKIEIFLNIADDTIFYPRKVEKLNGEFSLVYHGTITKRLGLDIAVKAVNIVKDKIPGLKFYIYGEGDYLDELLTLCQDMKLDDTVWLSKKFLPVEKLPDLIAKADVGIVPNRNDLATGFMLPVKLLEYIAMRIPCIVSKTNVIKYYFDDSMVRYFEPENVQELADAILELYQNPDKREKLSKNASKFCEQFKWQEYKKTYFNIIDKQC